MPKQEDILEQQLLLQTYRQTLSHYLKQQAILGTAYMPPSVAHGIREARAQIRLIKKALRSWNVPVNNDPRDEEMSEEIKYAQNKDEVSSSLQSEEERIRKSDPNELCFAEIAIKLSDTWDNFLAWIYDSMKIGTLDAIQEDQDRLSSFYHSGKPGHLSYYLKISGKKRGISVTHSVDIIGDWLHPLAIELAGFEHHMLWDSSLFPVKNEFNQEVFINKPLAIAFLPEL